MKSRIKLSRLAYVMVCGLLVFASLLLGACKNTGAGKRHKLAFVTNNASDFWTIARKGTEKAAAELPNADVEFRINSDGTAAEQQRVIDDLLAKGIEGIAISPVDPVNQLQMLNRAAHLETQALERRLVVFLTLLEPVMILVMGGVVLMIVLAILLPIIEINQLVH